MLVLLTIIVQASLPHGVGAVAVDDNILEDCFAFVFARKVVFLAFVDQVVCAFVIETLVPSVAASKWFVRKPSRSVLGFVVRYA